MNAAPAHPAYRFSLRAMMKWVAFAALALGTLRILLGLEKGPVAQLIFDAVTQLFQLALIGLIVGLPFVLFYQVAVRPAAARYDRRLWELKHGIDRWKDDDR